MQTSFPFSSCYRHIWQNASTGIENSIQKCVSFSILKFKFGLNLLFIALIFHFHKNVKSALKGMIINDATTLKGEG